MRAKIITDSVSDISPDIAELYGIDVLPIEISVGSHFESAYDVPVSESVKWIEYHRKRIEYKGVGDDVYTRVFEKYVSQGMGIICITGGSAGISNYACASHAATNFPGAIIYIIDSHQLSSGVAIIALEAAIMAQEGASANAIAIRLERTMQKFRHVGVADNVQFLQYAGLCPKVVAVGSGLLNAKFEFIIIEENKFDVQIIGNSMDKAVKTFCKKVFKDLKIMDPKILFLMYTISDEEYFSYVYKYIQDLEYFEQVAACEAGHYTTSIVGRNGIGAAFMFK
ncbi:MAG: DegV family protein [Clostridia bacterium]|nr:DegV family protein [Clostridia bacterium]